MKDGNSYWNQWRSITKSSTIEIFFLCCHRVFNLIENVIQHMYPVFIDQQLYVVWIDWWSLAAQKSLSLFCNDRIYFRLEVSGISLPVMNVEYYWWDRCEISILATTNYVIHFQFNECEKVATDAQQLLFIDDLYSYSFLSRVSIYRIELENGTQW